MTIACACGYCGKSVGDTTTDPPVRCSSCGRPARQLDVGESQIGATPLPRWAARAIAEILHLDS